MRKEAVMVKLKELSDIFLKGLRKTTKNSVRVVCVKVEIRTGGLLNTNHKVTA
jgi:hypothetical protein